MVDQVQFDGFYTAYFAGASGNSFGIFVFKDGVIAGADVGGGCYDGQYSVTEDQQHIEGSVEFILPAGNVTITGISAESEPLRYEVPIKLPTTFTPEDVHRIETPAGPVNAKFTKIRGG